MIDKSKWIGIFEIDVISPRGTKHFTIKNRVMDTFLNSLVDCIDGTTPDIEFKYLAVGTGDTAVTDTDATLEAEIFRTPPSLSSSRPSVGRREVTFTLLKTDFAANIKEVAIFAGSTATITADTGTMASRILWNYEKSADEEIVIKRIDILSRG